LGNSKRILLAEDDPRDVELTLSALSENHLANEIMTVRDGVETLDYLYRRGNYSGYSEGNPMLILLDLKMPRLDGLEVLRHLKSDERMKTIPIVILTSSRESRDLRECYQLGANAYVVKPVRYTDFTEAVKGIGLFWLLINEPLPNAKMD
jgi:CheY-like chemotaxis protein